MAGTTFFQAVDEWLQQKGFCPLLAREGTQDGNLLRKSLSELKASSCASDGCCAKTYVQTVLTQMKDEPGWTDDQALSALEAAGFIPSDFQL
ncbi:MAG: hypothetical protein ACI9SY_000299 [Candidatus Paceibacteria bacterium]|jgi:hypothetical protein